MEGPSASEQPEDGAPPLPGIAPSSTLPTATAPLTCPQCSKNFGSRIALQRHSMVHTGERPYACTHCRATFRCSSHLKRHERLHTGERPYVCAQCSKSYPDSTSLLRHREAVHDMLPYPCGHCEAAFSLERELRQHLEQKHDMFLLPANGRARTLCENIRKSRRRTSKQRDSADHDSDDSQDISPRESPVAAAVSPQGAPNEVPAAPETAAAGPARPTAILPDGTIGPAGKLAATRPAELKDQSRAASAQVPVASSAAATTARVRPEHSPLHQFNPDKAGPPAGPPPPQHATAPGMVHGAYAASPAEWAIAPWHVVYGGLPPPQPVQLYPEPRMLSAGPQGVWSQYPIGQYPGQHPVGQYHMAGQPMALWSYPPSAAMGPAFVQFAPAQTAWPRPPTSHT
eukprot:m.50696 g.50696  ORF g.50696 m.50696 type:complete len:400 (+) comp6248_c0_seq1:2216-3415(+)